MAANTSIELVRNSDPCKVKCVVSNPNVREIERTKGTNSPTIHNRRPIVKNTSVTSITRRRSSVISKVLPRQISKTKVVLGDATKTQGDSLEQKDPER